MTLKRGLSLERIYRQWRNLRALKLGSYVHRKHHAQLQVVVKVQLRLYRIKEARVGHRLVKRRLKMLFM